MGKGKSRNMLHSRKHLLTKSGLLLVITLLMPVWALPLPALAASKDPTLNEQYQQAKSFYRQLSGNASMAEDRRNWLTAARKFRKVYQTDQNHDLAPASLFMIARVYLDLYERFRNPLDLGESIAYNEDIVSLYSHHRLADDALFNIAKLYREERHDPVKAGKILERLLKNYPDGDMAKPAALLLARQSTPSAPDHGNPVLITQPMKKAVTELPLNKRAEVLKNARIADGPPADLKPLRYWSTSNYTRVVIETTTPVNYRENLLAETENQPRRLYIDLENCRVMPELQKAIPIDDGLLRQVRSGQYSTTQARVVLDTQSLSDYKVFSLNDPFRIVIDVRGERSQAEPTIASAGSGSDREPSLVQQLGLGIRRIVLDPGHGGKDSGAIGVGGLKEKDIVLAVAKQVAARLRERLDCEVIMTRDSDVFIPLEERTAIANTREGDLFISIHANAAPTSNVRGIETYILDLARNKSAMQVAARENATSDSQISNLQTILLDLIQNSKKNESIKLAEYVQESMVSGLKMQKYQDVRDLGVKQAPFVVLVGAQMPAILTEIAFISNPHEAAWLKSKEYQNLMADQIVSGVSGYINDLNLAYLQ
jgi:N-acetylmuramoyl-L-alanine amidase